MDPITRKEKFLARAGGQDVETPDPITRKEFYLAKAAGQNVETPEPITREEVYLDAIAEGGGGGSAVLVDKTIIENGEYDPADDSADGYSSVVANVPNSYAAGDEGKVVSNGELVSQSSVTYTENGTYDTTTKNSVTVNVSGGGGGEIVTITVDVANNTATADKTLQEIKQMTNPVAVFTDSSGRAYITTDQGLTSTSSQTVFHVNGFGLDYSNQEYSDNIYGRCSAIGVHYSAVYRSGRTSYSSGIDAYTFSHVTT